MPKTKRRSRKKLVAKKPSKALGALPSVIREGTFSEKYSEKLASLKEAVRSKDCPLAFSKLVDTLSYAGMAEEAAASAGKDPKVHSSKAAEALREFRAACKVG